jgi:hypothetical protein
MDPKLVIFDCDGVLVDTERMVNASLAEMVTELGFPITGPECQQRFMGRTLENVKEMVEALIGRTSRTTGRIRFGNAIWKCSRRAFPPLLASLMFWMNLTGATCLIVSARPANTPRCGLHLAARGCCPALRASCFPQKTAPTANLRPMCFFLRQARWDIRRKTVLSLKTVCRACRRRGLPVWLFMRMSKIQPATVKRCLMPVRISSTTWPHFQVCCFLSREPFVKRHFTRGCAL